LELAGDVLLVQQCTATLTQSLTAPALTLWDAAHGKHAGGNTSVLLGSLV